MFSYLLQAAPFLIGGVHGPDYDGWEIARWKAATDEIFHQSGVWHQAGMDSLGRLTRYCCENAKTKPLLYGSGQIRVSLNVELVGVRFLHNRGKTHPDRGHGLKRATDQKIKFIAGIKIAEIHHAVFNDEPPTFLRCREFRI